MASLLEVAGFPRGDVYRACVSKVRAVVVHHGPFEPPVPGEMSAVQQSLRHSHCKYKLGWHGGGDAGKCAFLHSAKSLPHPAHDEPERLPADLRAVIDMVVGKRESMACWRGNTLQLLQDVASDLQPLNQAMLATCCPRVLYLVKGYNLALMACLGDATGHPDKYLVRHFLRGFPVYGMLPAAGVFVAGGKPPLKQVHEVRTPANNRAWNKEVYATVGARGLKAARDRGSEAWLAIEAVWESTAKELAAGWSIGIRESTAGEAPTQWRGFLPEELHKHAWMGHNGSCRYIRRFGVRQNEATRPIDDCTEQGDNSITGGQDKLTLIRADMPVRVAQQFAASRVRWEAELRARGRWEQSRGSAEPGEVEAFEVASDDAKKAFRRVPTAEVQVVCVFNPVLLRAELVMLPGFVFGCLSAVMAWNRYSHYTTHVGRRALAVPTTAYYDDFQIYGPPWDVASAQACFGALTDNMIGFDAAKHLVPDQTRVVLGVESDFSRLPLDQHALMAVTEARREKLRETLRALLFAGSMSHATGVRVYGKCRWVLCPRFGRIYLAALHPLRQERPSSSFSPTSELGECLVFLLRVLDVLRPVRVPLFPVRAEPPVLVFSDASYKTKNRVGELGVVVWCPVLRQLFCAGGRLPGWTLCLFEYLCKQLTYICQAELYAALCAYVTFPDLLRGRLVHHFIDNKAAEAGLVKGTSPRPASARILLEYHVQIFRLQCQPWVSFVYSEDNISDLPSRGDFALLESVGAVRRRLVFPTLRQFIFQ